MFVRSLRRLRRFRFTYLSPELFLSRFNVFLRAPFALSVFYGNWCSFQLFRKLFRLVLPIFVLYSGSARQRTQFLIFDRLYAPIVQTANTHCPHWRYALCTLHARIVHAAHTHCARCTHAFCTLQARIVQTARTHALCTLHAPIVHAPRAHCARCTHALCKLHASIVQTAHTHCVRCMHALCTLHARIVHVAGTHPAHCMQALCTMHALKCMIAETTTAVAVDKLSAAVLFTRYMDTTYLGFLNVLGNLLLAVRHFVEIFQHILYEVPFKWEPGSQFLNWGECSVMCTDTLSLTMKEVPPVEPFFDPEMWDRWPDRWLPNYPLVLQSIIPALVHKAFQLCNSTQCRGQNIKGLVLGDRYKHYKWVWWYMPLTGRLQALNLQSLCDYHILKAWVLDGASFAVSLCRVSGCTSQY